MSNLLKIIFKKGLFRFKLRTLLIFITTLCLLLGFQAYKANEQRKAVEWVKSNGGFVRYRYQWGRNRLFPDSSKFETSAFVQFIGIDFFSTVVHVDLIGTEVSDITPLTGLKNLQSLSLQKTKVEDLSPIEKLDNLRFLYLQHTRVRKLEPLKKCDNLRGLWLVNTPVEKSMILDLKQFLPELDIIY